MQQLLDDLIWRVDESSWFVTLFYEILPYFCFAQVNCFFFNFGQIFPSFAPALMFVWMPASRQVVIGFAYLFKICQAREA